MTLKKGLPIFRPTEARHASGPRKGPRVNPRKLFNKLRSARRGLLRHTARSTNSPPHASSGTGLGSTCSRAKLRNVTRCDASCGSGKETTQTRNRSGDSRKAGQPTVPNNGGQKHRFELALRASAMRSAGPPAVCLNQPAPGLYAAGCIYQATTRQRCSRRVNREANRQPTEALRPAISSGHEAHETSDRVS